MVKMTFDEFDKKLEDYKQLPLPQLNYGFTKEDIEIMRAKPKKYLDFMMYILSLPAYDKFKERHDFINPDALPQETVVKEINKIMCNLIELED